MNKINGWKGYLGLSALLTFFSLALFFDTSGLETYVANIGGTIFAILTLVTLWTSRKLWKKSQDERNQ